LMPQFAMLLMGEEQDWVALAKQLPRDAKEQEGAERRSPRLTRRQIVLPQVWQASHHIDRPSALPSAPALAALQARTTVQVNLFGRSIGASSSMQQGSAASADAQLALAALERACAPKREAPPKGDHGPAKAIPRSTKETDVPLEQRLEEFPEECLKVSGGKLFCPPCKEEWPNLKERIKRHVRCKKHLNHWASFERAKKKNADLINDVSV
ncbi:MAG: hypothetical protein SGPRY_003337, partial [Prymnesium sp.]